MNKPVHWRDILGNPYTKSPSIEMLREGSISSERRAVRGDSKSDVFRVFVKRDRAYVVAWLAKKVIIPLGIHTKTTKYNDFQKLISESVEYAKQIDNDNQRIPSEGEESI